MSQEEKGRIFRDLHRAGSAFVVPNPWDAGTAQLLTSLGFKALATTSSGVARTLGREDHGVGRELMLGRIAEIVAATELPVSGDLEDGYANDPAAVAETILLAAQTGLVGGSIEDVASRPDYPVYEKEFAAERLVAAAEAAKGLRFPFTLTGRAENYIVGIENLADTIARLQAYQEAGADVLFAPGLKRKEDIEAVVRSVDRPVNILVGLPGMTVTVAELAEIGVKRISIGGGLSRAAMEAVKQEAAKYL